jgi:hypothetical protein
MSTTRSDFDPLERPDYEPRGMVYAGAMPILQRVSGEFSFFIAAAVVYAAFMVSNCALAAIS